jgi:hypothetical protein
MSLRSPAGYIYPGYDPLKVPNAPTIGAATGGDGSVSVAFTAPSNVGGSAITSYTVIASNGSFGTGSSSPISVTGLTNGVSYTFYVFASNSFGPSAASGTVSQSAGIPYMTISTTGSPTITTDGNFRVIRFTGSGSFTVNALGADPTFGATVDHLIVAGGGAGGRSAGAGGGAGGFIYTTSQSVTATTYTITVGGGGSSPSSNPSRGNNGADSSAFSRTALGGGGGGCATPPNSTGRNGGSGGGAGYSGSPGSGYVDPISFANQGFAGGLWDDDPSSSICTRSLLRGI